MNLEQGLCFREETTENIMLFQKKHYIIFKHI